MNIVLYLHDPTLVWDPTDPTILKRVQREINELIGDYTMGLVTVDMESDVVPQDYGGHEFQVMCSRCLDEPFDAADECPEQGDDDFGDEQDEEP